MTATEERNARRRVNNALNTLGRLYHDGLPIDRVDDILTAHGFEPTQPAIYCGRDGRVTERVGERSYLTLTWHKMPSGRYEVVAYVN